MTECNTLQAPTIQNVMFGEERTLTMEGDVVNGYCVCGCYCGSCTGTANVEGGAWFDMAGVTGPGPV